MSKRKKKQKQTTDFYAIEITDWDLHYGINFSPNRHKRNLDIESLSLTCHGKMVFPEKISGRVLEARLLASRRMTRVFNENSHNYAEVNSAGGLHVWGNRGNFLLLYVPHDMITNIILALEARIFKFIKGC
jgi:hypothetical protein